MRSGQATAGWLFVTPVLVLLGLFLVLPIVMAAWVSVSDWTGRGNPFGGAASFVGAENYAELLAGGALAQRDFATALRNNAYYVLLVVPLQTVVSLGLAVLVNRRVLRGRGFFRTAFYFPSVTSSVAITVVFLFLFTASGAVNRMLSYLSVEGPNWINDPRGVLHIALGALGVDRPPAALEASPFLGLPWWQWLAGPSVALCVFIVMAIFTTSGTFMLLFLAALQNISGEVEEAAMVDGTTAWQRLRHVTIPMLRPTIFTVVTLGLIGTWQVFDQIYTGSRGAPAKTTLTPAYLAYETSFNDQQWGRGAAIAFILFAIIVVMTIIQRIVLVERDVVPARKRFYRAGRSQGGERA
ncbi:carbohydrate ABC transporter permease [Myceligenerans pegani]|uniref:Sugar ABC transporter permease n=1 Tax=Myceligenerans pegani TaxID=2776917 RepID=A0ABR9MT59_9MICO|nr:sugar ABC transporter permease [Myceligenerans sp. TRM 65318]MBE1874544.1 sugar ABC transporter permease [Myceligenerans sp. TRM 65318]MBE3016815.1 sugar ABC transporter permease [Myceligenerans sp. TRM 65318]